MNKREVFVCLLLVLIGVLLVMLHNQKENYHQSEEAIILQQKVAVISKYILEAYTVYTLITQKIPEVKNMLQTISNWNILQPKLCKWAQNKQLIPGLLNLVNTVLQKKQLSQSVTGALQSFKKVLLKLEVGMTIVHTVKSISDLLPAIPSDVKSYIDTIDNMDNSLITLLVKVPGFGTCS